MKTFRTVGSGSTQTIEPIENNKIPVYETKTAAETDLANLEVGQIIATKDEGNEYAKPVDVVESGNMHAVTSNAVAESLCTVSIPPFDSNYILWAREVYNPVTKVVTILASIKDGTSPTLGQDLMFPIHKGDNNLYTAADVKVAKLFEPNHRILLRGVNYSLQVDGISDVNTQIEISYISE